MKFKNVKLGQEVKVKSGGKSSNSLECLEGLDGTVVGFDKYCCLGLTIEINIGNGELRWVNHKDIRLIENTD